MKKIITLLLFISSQKLTMAQNVGIGTTTPMNKLDVMGSLLINAPLAITTTPPTPAQTYTLVNGTNIYTPFGDSTGRIYDPGGPSGNYVSNLFATLGIEDPGNAGIAMEITLEDVQLGTGDSLILKDGSSTGTVLLAIGNGYSNTGKWIFNTTRIFVTFKSNADANNGRGFALLYRRFFDNDNLSPDVTGFAGQSLFFDAKKGALRTGNISLLPRGNNSFAAGNNVTASGAYAVSMGSNSVAIGFASLATGLSSQAIGDYSTAMGVNAMASGERSIAIGSSTTASGDRSNAMGTNTIASGLVSTAMGFNTTATGDYSTAIGRLTTAGGNYSTAMGYSTIANGTFSTAMGDAANASGSTSTAMGHQTTATGDYSTAMGANTTASGLRSTAIGGNTTASGDRSIAMGNYVSTNNQEGSFVIGDNSTTTVMNSANANNFRARFAGGYKLFTSANLSTGCTLFAGDNAWTTGSDFRTKENFAAVNGEDFLQKIAALQLTSWNYKTQNPTTFRHYGPMAQDFYAAFGKDKYGTIGNDTTINSADFAGVSFIAIQALEKRTTRQEENINSVKKENAGLAAKQEELEKLLKQQQQLIELMQKEIELLKRK